jgi:hypothetical protein
MIYKFRMTIRVTVGVALSIGLLGAGCGTYPRRGLDPTRVREREAGLATRPAALTREREDHILALNPARVTAQEVREVLIGTPAPHLFNIHGGEVFVIPCMINFATFLIGMGYPGQSLTNPADGTYTFSCYESSELIAGLVAWYYERDGLRPMLVGHSQGGMQAVKVLYRLAGAGPVPVWNPLTWAAENRSEITDPLTGQPHPVAGLQTSYTSVVGAGGVTRLLPNQWDMTFRLRTIPDSTVEFVGFCKVNDLLGGEFFGYGSVNEYKAANRAVVHNVWLPKHYDHSRIPWTTHLLGSPAMVDWIHNYQPPGQSGSEPPSEPGFDEVSKNILWAAENWYYIKKHWVLELQRLIRAQRARRHDF